MTVTNIWEKVTHRNELHFKMPTTQCLFYSSKHNIRKFKYFSLYYYYNKSVSQKFQIQHIDILNTNIYRGKYKSR